MNTNKGFTIVELLAVIVILAIILIIAVPSITDVIDNAQKDSLESSARVAASEALNQYLRSNTYGEFYYQEGQEYNISGNSLLIDNNNIEQGYLLLTQSGEVGLAFYDGQYCAIKNTNSEDIVVTEVAAEDCKSYVDESGITKISDGEEDTSANSNRTYIGLNGEESEAEVLSGVIEQDFYTIAYIDATSTFPYDLTYNINLDHLEILLEDITSVDVISQRTMSTEEDFKEYVIRKSKGDISYPAGESADYELKEYEVYQDYSALPSNTTVNNVSVTCTTSCVASVDVTINNLDDVKTTYSESGTQISYIPTTFTVRYNESDYDLNSKMYYSVGYVAVNDTFPKTVEYTIDLDNLPGTTSDSYEITYKETMTSYNDYMNYIVRKMMGDVSIVGDNQTLNIDQSQHYYENSLGSDNMMVNTVLVDCATGTCKATINITINNIAGTTSTNIGGSDIIYMGSMFEVKTNGLETNANIKYIYKPIFQDPLLYEIEEIYNSLDGFTNPITDCGTSDDYYNGNYQSVACIASGATTNRLNQETNNSGHRISSGTNTYTLASQPTNSSNWIKVAMIGSCYTSTTQYSNITLNFTDGNSYNVEEAINQNYINPLVIFGSSSSNSSYVFPNTYDAMTGGSSGSQDYANLYFYIKPLNKTLESISLYSSRDSGYYSTCSDGLHVLEYTDINLSLVSNSEYNGVEPMIVIGNNTGIVSGNNIFVENSVSVFDAEDGDLGEEVIITGNIDYEIAGDYNITFSVTDNDGNTVSKEKIITVIEEGYPGEDIYYNYTDLYTTVNSFDSIIPDCGSSDDYFEGNYQHASCLSEGAEINKLNYETNNYRDKIISGDNTYDFVRPVLYDASWIKLEMIGGCYTSTTSLSNLILYFEDGYSGFINEAINDGYLEKQVIYASARSSLSYVFPTPEDFLSGGSTGSQDYADIFIYVKQKGQKLTNVSFSASRDSGYYSTCSDGLGAYELLNWDISVYDRTTLQIQEPVLTIDDLDEKVTQGSEFVETGMFAFDYQEFNMEYSLTSINPLDINTVGIYNTTYSITDSDGNTSDSVIKKVEVLPKGTYEDDYSVLHSEIYTTIDGFTDPFADCGSSDDYFNGNYRQARCLTTGAKINKLSQETPKTRHYISSGTNTYTFEELPVGDSSWIRLMMYGSCYTSTTYYSEITLNFTDGYSGYISEAINDGYIDPFILYGSAASSSSYVFSSTINTITGGSSGYQDYANLYFFIKPINKTLKSVTFYANRNSGTHSSCSDGFDAYELINWDLSTTPQ